MNQGNQEQQNNIYKKRLLGVLIIIMALIIMQLPSTTADAAYSTDFKMDGNTLIKYRGPDKNVTIPDTVEVIGKGAFEDNVNIELVVIPNSVKRIDPYAFWGCNNLDTVVLGQGLTEVGDYAFAGCKGLKQMTIPSNVNSIGIQAFGDCVNMTDISIPPETVKIHETSFNGCEQLTIHGEEHSVAAEYAEAFQERQKEKAEFEDTMGLKPSVTEAPVETPIPTEAPVVESLVGSTQIVGNRAVFLIDGQGLPVYDGLPESETPPLGDMMGSGNIPKYTVIDEQMIADHAYYSSIGLGNLMLPDGIGEIGEFSFARSSLTALLVPDGVEKIDYGAFYHCDLLEHVTLPDTIMSVEPKAFSYTPWVENFLSGNTGEGDFLIEGGVLIAYRGNFSNVTIPDGVRVIAAEVFQGHTEIKSVSFPDSLRVIGEGAFEGCNQLKQINFGQGVEEIKDRAFSGISTLLSELSIPGTVKKLGLQAFGSIWLNYQGEEPEHTFETSASRLSNKTYRIYGNEQGQEPGVMVEGLEGASASMETAESNYLLKIEELQESDEMAQAFYRAFQAVVPDNRVIYDMVLTDESSIPLTKLGTQALTVVLPVPEALQGQNLRLLVLDRNGQLEDIPIERISIEGKPYYRFQTNFVSQYIVYGIGEDMTEVSAEIPMEMDMELTNLSAAPQEEPFWRRLELWVGGALLLTGIILLSGRVIKFRVR
ncbi:MAG: leucine-rich repeat domain-containing protein [Lachnospiraceae bacterium]|nr:leucine-rich repeat domain-containing protein [Lachnospiraceae bacterium]